MAFKIWRKDRLGILPKNYSEVFFLVVDADYTQNLTKNGPFKIGQKQYQNPSYKNIFTWNCFYHHTISKPRKVKTRTENFSSPQEQGMPTWNYSKLVADNIIDSIKARKKIITSLKGSLEIWGLLVLHQQVTE